MTTTGADWFDLRYANLSETPVLSNQTATMEDGGTIGLAGWWSVQTTLPPGEGTITYRYTHLGSSGNNMIAFQAAQAAYDYGDAPLYYDGNAASAARHALGADLWLGSRAPDRDDFPTGPWWEHIVEERDDSDAEGDDEDGVSISVGDSSVDATVTVVNDSNEAAQVCCWLDGATSSQTGTVNINRAFEDTAPEKQCIPVPARSGRNQYDALSWDFPYTSRPYRTYVRCRLSTASTISPTGALADGEVEDYHIDINEVIPCVADAELQDFFVFRGAAHQHGSYRAVLTVASSRDQASAVMSRDRVDFRKPFTIAFQARFGTQNLRGADGMAAVFHNDPWGSAALGRPGSALGAGGIQNGIAIEFDTYVGSNENWGDRNQGKMWMDHTSIWDTDRIVGGHPVSYLTTAIGHGDIEDGKWHDVEISWDPATETLSYTLDRDRSTAGSYTYSGTTDFVTEYFGGATMVYFGITAATGGLTNLQDIQFPDFCKLPLGFDADGDGVANTSDIDDDNDGITDCVENGLDTARVTDVFAFSGTAYRRSSREAVLTVSSKKQAGGVMSKDRVDFREPFTIAFRALFGVKDRHGADGIAAVFHNDSRGSRAIGNPGATLGAGGIQKGIALEFDTYADSNENWGGGQGSDHTSIWDTDRIVGGHPVSYLTTAIGHDNIEDNKFHDVEIRWDPVTKTLSYTLDGATAGSYTYSGTTDFVTEYFGGAHQVHFGVTAGGFTKAKAGKGKKGKPSTVVQRIRFGNFCNLPLWLDTDGDGVPNHHDLDIDADGISDLLESGAGDDGSPVNPLDWHNDGEIDGVFIVGANGLSMVIEEYNGENTGTTPRDTDDDGTPDYHDLYSDADSCPDAIEGVRRYFVDRAADIPSFDFGDIVSDGSLDQSVYPADDRGRHDGTVNQGVGSAADSSVNACTE